MSAAAFVAEQHSQARQATRFSSASGSPSARRVGYRARRAPSSYGRVGACQDLRVARIAAPRLLESLRGTSTSPSAHRVGPPCAAPRDRAVRPRRSVIERSASSEACESSYACPISSQVRAACSQSSGSCSSARRARQVRESAQNANQQRCSASRRVIGACSCKTLQLRGCPSRRGARRALHRRVRRRTPSPRQHHAHSTWKRDTPEFYLFLRERALSPIRRACKLCKLLSNAASRSRRHAARPDN